MEEANDDHVSKSQLKRESDAAQNIGEELLKLKPAELEHIDLPENLQVAIEEAKKLKSNSALKRQRHYIGKLMRDVDIELITNQLNQIKHKHDYNIARLKQIEVWRDSLIEGDKNTLTEIIQAHPETDRQFINQIIRQAKHEQEKKKPPAASRKLFKYLRELVEG